MVESFQPLALNFQIVDQRGFPTPYFIKWAQQRGLGQDDLTQRVGVLDTEVADIEAQLGTFLVKTANLSDVPNKPTARTNLGVSHLRYAGFAPTSPLSSEVLLDFISDTAFSLAANLVGCTASCGTNPAATFVLDVQKNGLSIGSITISTLGVVTFATTGAAAQAIVIGDVLTVLGPAVADTNIMRLRFTLQGTIT